MMRGSSIALFALLGVAPLNGCAAIQQLETNAANAASSTINTTAAAVLQVDAAYNSAANKQARNIIAANATAAVCKVANASAAAAQLTAALGPSSHGTVVAVRDLTDVYVASSTVCKMAGGTVAGVAVVPASAMQSGA